MIERVIGAFKNLGFDLDDTEIADILWLSVEMRRSQSSPLPQLQQQTPASTPEITPNPPQSAINQNKKSPKSSSKTETSANVYPQPSQDSNQTSSGLPIKVPTAKALRNQLAISRSLKPLKRRVPSKSKFILDEAATAERIAEEKLLLPVMRRAPERWLELALVIDEEASMMLWKQTIKEFKQLLERHGAFRDVRTWGLFISVDSKVWLRSRTASVSRQKKLHNPRELIDPNGRRLFVIISDCVSPAWRNGTITKALAAWASTSPMTIIQVLPEWLWERSALGVADSILLRSLAPGVPNQQLIMTALDLLDESNVFNKLKVPVVTLEPESLKNWAWMVAGAGDVQTKGFLLALDAEIFDIDDESTENTSVQLSAKQRLQRFRLTASPMARKLAGLLAAAPVSLPVVRLIRQTMLPKSSQVHVAEVFLGGILKPLSPIDEGLDADKIQYDFVDGVRDLLLDAVPLTELTEVLRKVSEYVAQRTGLSVDDFTAMLINPGLVDDSSGVLIRPFAQVTAKVLRRLGGKYAELAEEMEQSSEELSQTRVLNRSLNLAKTKDLEQSSPKLSQTRIPSPSLNLAIARLVNSGTDNFAIWVVNAPYPSGYVLHDCVWNQELNQAWLEWQQMFAGHSRLDISPKNKSKTATPLPLNSLSPAGGKKISYSSRLMQYMGVSLWRWVFEGEILGSLERSRGIAMGHHTRLHFRLEIREPDLIALPWEVMQREPGQPAMSLSQHLLFSRTTSQVEPLSSSRTDRALNIFLVLGEDENLQLEAEAAILQQTFSGGNQLGGNAGYAPCIVKTLLKPTPQQLIAELETKAYNVFFYAGHGLPGPDGGFLFLRDDMTLNGMELAQALTRTDVKLAVFNACWGAQPFSDKNRAIAHSSLAEVLIRQGVPAVLGMRDEITDEESHSFIQSFALALRTRKPIDEAVAEGRKRLLTIYHFNQPAWTLPVLYLHPHFDGELLKSFEEGATEISKTVIPGKANVSLRSLQPGGKTWLLKPGVTRIGRVKKNDIVIREPSVSKSHAEILCRKKLEGDIQVENYYLQDLSTYGTTWVSRSDGWEQIYRREIPLESGMHLKFGSKKSQTWEFRVEN